MRAAAAKTYLAVDNTKLGKVSFVKLFDLEGVAGVITENTPETKWIEHFRANRVEIY